MIKACFCDLLHNINVLVESN